MNTIQPGDHVLARAANGELLGRRAITEPIAGDDFRVVWVCTEDEWLDSVSESREPEGIPWPAEDVKAIEHAAV